MPFDFLDAGLLFQEKETMTVSKCKNCGHDSHCGSPLIKDVDGSGPIEVCKNCRCSQCTAPDWG